MRTSFILLSILIAVPLTSCGMQEKIDNKPRLIKKIETEEKTSANSSARDIALTEPAVLREENQGIVPATIEIPSISVKASIETVGTMPNGQMGVPEGIDHVGWFEPGTKPGERGNAVMAGHVDSKTGPAVFYNLKNLKAGDEVILKDANGTSRIFKVTGKKSYPRNDAPLQDIFGYSYNQKLNLITCTGEFNRKARTHEERLVVYTELSK